MIGGKCWDQQRGVVVHRKEEVSPYLFSHCEKLFLDNTNHAAQKCLCSYGFPRLSMVKHGLVDNCSRSGTRIATMRFDIQTII